MDTAPLIGRTEEMTAVRSAVTRARAGSGGVLLIVGEAGVGKSRLLTEAVRLARGDRVHVLCGRATESGGAYLSVRSCYLDAQQTRGPAGSFFVFVVRLIVRCMARKATRDRGAM